VIIHSRLNSLQHLAFLTLVLVSQAFCVSGSLQAQGAQKYGFQAAALATSIGSGSSAVSGVGIEIQLRANTLHATEHYALSLGLGGQFTAHNDRDRDIKIAGAFLEPRWTPALGNSRVFPYVSGRLAYLRQSSNFGSSSMGLGVGAGGGVAVKLTRTINLDAGIALVRQQFGNFQIETSGGKIPGSFAPFTTYAAKIGVSLGFPDR
jgi:hypothetical protein